MADFQSAVSPEQFDRLVIEVYEHVKEGTLSKNKVIGVAKELIKMRDEDGELVFYDFRVEDEKKPIVLDTMIGRIRIIVQNWKKYLGPLMQTLLVEAAYKHATKAKENVTSFKAVSELIAPKEESDETELVLPPSAEAIRKRATVATRITIGKGAVAQGTGNNGHECADTVHLVADGQQEDITVEVVSFGDDKPVHGVYEGSDTPERPFIPDTSVAPEDADSDDSGADLDASE